MSKPERLPHNNMQAIVLDPLKEAPGTIRRQMQPDRLCVMFYGPPANKVGFCSVHFWLPGHSLLETARYRLEHKSALHYVSAATE